MAAAQIRTRSYRELLTPALHRRFTRAAGAILLVCYIEAVVVGDKSSLLWSWFPLGPAGIRAGLLFISCLLIFVLRVAQLHFGDRLTASPFETFRQYWARFNTLQTVGFYLFSAWWFSEVYVWSAPKSANLHWIAEGKPYERPQLNDRPIYLRSVYFLLAVLQSFRHLHDDYDKMVFPRQHDQRHTHPKVLVPFVLRRAVKHALIMSIVGPIVYVLLIQKTAWVWTLYFAKLVWSVSKASEPSLSKPFHITLFARSFTSGFMLLTLWELSNAALDIYLPQPPLKMGFPLTQDSRDPNGSLLNGLRSRKDITKAFAFWELTLITQLFEARRKSIYSEIERPGGTTWTQTMTSCLGNIQEINTRIKIFQDRPSSSTTSQQAQSQDKVQNLPRLSAPVKQDNILTNPRPPAKRREQIESTIGSVTKSYGQAPNQGTPLKALGPYAMQGLKTAREKLLNPEQQEVISGTSLKSTLNKNLMKFLQSRYGKPFRQIHRRRLCAVIFGAPYSSFSIVLNSVDSLRELAKASLTEDLFGTVSKDTPLLVRTFVSTINNIESFTKSIPIHWTDVEFDVNNEQGRKVEEVQQVVDRLKDGLKDLVTAFGDYAADLGLGPKEMELARQVAGLDTP